uniref:Gustatory receptor n=1 Tax=Tetranychus urticae TaxID=32264 RepID=T1KNE4_TETUR
MGKVISQSKVKRKKIKKLKTKMEKSRQFSKLSAYFEKQLLIHFNYIPVNHSKRRQLVSYIALIIFISVTIKTIVFTLLPADNPILYYLGDATIEFGAIRTPLDCMLSIWTLGGLYCGLFLKYTNQSVKHQHWVRVNQLLNTKSPAEMKVIKLFLHQTQSNLILAFLVTVGLNIPLLFQCPPGFYSLNIVYLGLHGVAGFLVSAYAINFAFFFGLDMFFVARRFKSYYRSLKTLVRYKAISDFKRDTLIRRSVRHITSQLKQIIETYHFWEKLNHACFISSFINQSLILYLVFCSPTRQDLKIVLSVYGLLNCATGQSLHFISANYAQKQIDHAISQLHNANTKTSQIKTKLENLNFLEYVDQRKYFTIFGSLEYSSKNLVTVTIENAATLLLLVTNLGYRQIF